MWLTRASRESRDAKIGAAALVTALMVAIAFVGSGFAYLIEDSLQDGRDRLRLAPATGEIAIVEIDGRSLEALDKWPWPRSNHAKAITELDRL
ncbi:MAG: CHASE2 domain-containing protein, partial [Pseudomonadota bacterium]